MFGMKERVDRVRARLHDALLTKAGAILAPFEGKPPEAIPKMELVRALVLQDIAEVIKGISDE